MIKVEGYKCDHCRTLYNTSDEAGTCERNHIMIVDVKPVYEKRDTFPKRIIVDLENGAKAYYEYEGHTGY